MTLCKIKTILYVHTAEQDNNIEYLGLLIVVNYMKGAGLTTLRSVTFSVASGTLCTPGCHGILGSII